MKAQSTKTKTERQVPKKLRGRQRTKAEIVANEDRTMRSTVHWRAIIADPSLLERMEVIELREAAWLSMEPLATLKYRLRKAGKLLQRKPQTRFYVRTKDVVVRRLPV